MSLSIKVAPPKHLVDAITTPPPPPPKMNEFPSQKKHVEKEHFIFQPLIFRGYVLVSGKVMRMYICTHFIYIIHYHSTNLQSKVLEMILLPLCHLGHKLSPLKNNLPNLGVMSCDVMRYHPIQSVLFGCFFTC